MKVTRLFEIDDAAGVRIGPDSTDTAIRDAISCRCEIRDRRWNPHTLRCETCGRWARNPSGDLVHRTPDAMAVVGDRVVLQEGAGTLDAAADSVRRSLHAIEFEARKISRDGLDYVLSRQPDRPFTEARGSAIDPGPHGPSPSRVAAGQPRATGPFPAQTPEPAGPGMVAGEILARPADAHETPGPALSHTKRLPLPFRMLGAALLGWR